MSPSVPISQFADRETVEPSTPTEPTVQPAANPTDQGATSQLEWAAQPRAQLECEPLSPVEPADPGRDAQETGANEVPSVKPMKRKWETTAPFEPELTEDEKKEARFLAGLATDPSLNAALVIAEFGRRLGDLQLNALVTRLSHSNNLVGANDMRQCEAMLCAQALALQSIFTNMAEKAARDMGQYLDATERWMRMALKAQNQCRMTLETLAALKNPRVVVAQQTNIAAGPQQVNIGSANAGKANDGHPPADNNGTGQNGLLETRHGKRLDD